MKKLIFSRWVQMPSILLAAVVALSGTAYGQANFFTIFGGNTTGTSCSPYSRMNCATAASSGSFTGLPGLITTSNPYDLYGYPYGGGVTSANAFQNSMYDPAGNLLFVANGDGFWAPDGTELFSFSSDFNYPGPPGCSSPPFEIFGGTTVLSEICLIPNYGKCNSYYAIFWCSTAYSLSVGGSLCAIEIDIDPLGFSEGHYSSCYTFQNPVLLDEPGCGTSASDDNSFYYNNIGGSGGTTTGTFEVAVNPNADHSFDVYTIENEFNTLSRDYYGVLRKWSISASGVLPTYTPSTMPAPISTALYPAATTKAKIFQIPPETGSGNHPVFAYVASSGSGGGHNFGYILQTYDLASNVSYTYGMPSSIGGTTDDIWGFEYITTGSSTPTYIVTYNDGNGLITSPYGGFGYAPVYGASGLMTNLSASGGAVDYSLSDLELDKYGDLMCVYNDVLTGSPDYYLAYIPESSLSSIISSFTLPTILTCDGSNPIPVQNFQYQGFNQYGQSYLGSQLRNFNYNSIKAYDIDNLTISGSVTWTPTSNPVYDATGIATPTLTVGPDGITIPEGASLTLNGMTLQAAANAYIDVKNSSYSSSSYGGRLVLNNSTLTAHTGGCDASFSMWGGVWVWGDPAQSQTPAGGTSVATTHQGIVTINNSTISYANAGVFAGELSPGIIFPTLVGGGVVQANGAIFDNDNYGVCFLPYSNFNPSAPHTEISNASRFIKCTFKSEDPLTAVSGAMYGIYGDGVKTIPIDGCTFTNNLGPRYTTYGIYGYNMGFNVSYYPSFVGSSISFAPSTFTNFWNGICHVSADASHTATVQHTTFTNNFTGIQLNGSEFAVVVGNTFNIPYSIFPYTGHYVSPVQSIGLFLNTAYNYSVYDNTFNFSSGTDLYMSPATAALNQTVGVLAYNTVTHDEDEKINNNVYKGLGTANLAEYINTGISGGVETNHGLWYECNTHSSNLYDIATMGNDFNNDGIRLYQGYPSGSTYASYIDGLPAGNTFSSGSSPFNLYNLPSQCLPFNYYYCPSTYGGTSLEKPGNPPVTANNDPTTIPLVASATADQCTTPPNLYVINNIGTLTPCVGCRVINPDPGGTPDGNSLIILNNISYYMNDTNGLAHRDSLYYWVSQLPAGSADIATSRLLLEDGFADSAYTLYHSIPTKDTLDSMASAEMNGAGSELWDVQTRIAAHYTAINQAIAYAYANGQDPDSTLAADSALFAGPILDTGSLDTLVHIFDSSHFWARIGAEGILSAYAADTLDSMLTSMPDTILYPTWPDTVAVPASPGGALVVTEISQGPVADTGACAYVEIMVTNCGTGTSPFVNVAGWIMDDNAGNFDTGSCSTGTGITPGHYRLDPNNAMWQNIRVGTAIVVYNADANCYNLPDTFTIDTVHYIVYVPVYVTTPDSGYVLQRYDGSGSTDPGAYCADTGSTVYMSAKYWQLTLALAPQDAIQVRCPGCTVATPGSPAFYQGMGYAPDSTYCFTSIHADSASPGGPIVYSYNTYRKYVFIGSTDSDFANPAMWVGYTADTAGTPPPTLGYVDSALYAAITGQTLGLPCCAAGSGGTGGSGSGGRKANPTAPQPAPKVVTDIRVYPNPVNGNIYFEFPAGNVSITLMDITGQVTDKQVINSGTSALFNVGNYTPGLYMYQVVANGITQTGKFVIAH